MAKKSSAEKVQKMLDRYGLGELSNEQDIASVMRIAQELQGTGLQEAGMTLSFGFGTKTSERLQVYYQRAILEQNWIIIRQLDRIAEALSR